jgi:cytochrome c biogenesis protein CcmG/thiol:disulfide interchange protein DsbE
VSVRSSIAVLGVVAVIGLLVFGLVSKGSSGLAVGDPAPNRPLPRLEGGGDGSVAEYKGQWVLVNIWASWCGPCRGEAPVMEKFQRQHGGPGFTVLGIDSRDLSSDGREFVKRYGLSYPQLRDGDGAAAHDFGTTGVPENFLVDPKGKVRLLVRGPVDETYLQDAVAPMIGGGKS